WLHHGACLVYGGISENSAEQVGAGLPAIGPQHGLVESERPDLSIIVTLDHHRRSPWPHRGACLVYGGVSENSAK
ncbi:hypothetical protein, partial [Pseudomonas guariconensis]|uniref:hypothetical protein n=1 Tax=Pseudomonas guariconensis TaxID=1288410 RepID=UPI001E4E96FE